MLGVLDVDEEEEVGVAGKPVIRWYYSLAEGIDPEVLTSPDLATLTPRTLEERVDEGEDEASLRRG
jgi:hypothetical protein